MDTTAPLSLPAEPLSGTGGLGAVILKKPFLLFTFIALGSWLVPPLAGLVFLGAALHALRGARQTIEAFTVTALVLLGTPLFFIGGDKSLRYIVFFAGFLGTMMDRSALKAAGRHAFRPVRRTFVLFILVLYVLSLLASEILLISMLKITSYAIVGITIIWAFDRTRHLQDYWRAWFLNYFVFLLGFSLLLNLGGQGYLRTPEGQQGVFVHPQTAGVVLSIVTSWIAGRFMLKSEPTILFPISFAGLALIWMTGSRTSLFSAVLGFGLAFVFYMMKGRSLAEYRVPSRGKTVAIGLALLLVVSQSSLLSSAITEFIEKGQETTDVSDTLALSRGQLIALSIENFWENPLMGIGFSVPSTYKMEIHNKGGLFMGIPIGYSVEKGFMPAAMLEEIGLIGVFMVIVVLLVMYRRVIRLAPFGIVWMFFSALMVNLGEAVFFSMGGPGFFVWLAIGFCLNQAYHPPEDDAEAPAAGDTGAGDAGAEDAEGADAGDGSPRPSPDDAP